MAAIAPSALGQERGGFGVRVQFGPDAERLLRQAENHTSRFAAMLDERNRDGLAERARELESQLNMVGQDFNEGSNYGRRSQVASVLRVGQSMSNAMRARRVASDVQRQWTLVRSDLNRLGRIYNLRQIS